MHTPFGSQTHTWFSEIIGMESCTDLGQNEEGVIDGGCKEAESIHRRCCDKRERRCAASRETKEFPPPIPLLARAENLPVVFKRHYTGDGRLIIWEEKVRHHEYFRAHRSNGRLTLQLVHLDDDDVEEERENYNVEPESNPNQVDHDEYEVGILDGADEKIRKDQAVEEGVRISLPLESVAVEGEAVVVGGGGKCYNYRSVRSNPCMYGISVPAIRPVHI